MRLLDARSLKVVNVLDDSIPEYAILSHTWSLDEVGFHELGDLTRGWQSAYEHEHNDVASNKRLSKVIGAANLAAQHGYSYIWMDTCCIDKSSSAELSEAINSMYRWYREAAVCYVYLSDVEPVMRRGKFGGQHAKTDWLQFQESRWFTRGWTLQELIAPADVRFYAKDWSYIGNHKESSELRDLLSRITGVDDRVLARSQNPQDLSVSTRMKWAALRRTTRTEDIAYCLMGIFGVNMPLLYGEGKRAFIRLQEEILKETDDQSLFAWTSDIRETEDSNHLCGLLAESPFAFINAKNVRPLPPVLTRDSFPSNITNQGLRIQLYLAPVEAGKTNSVEEEYYAVLDCSFREGNREYCPSIYLRRLWGDQFARVRAQDCVSRAPPTDNTTRSSIGYQIVFVRQRPVYIMPEFTLPSGDNNLTSTLVGVGNYVIRAVHPPDRWDWSSLSLKSVYSQLDGVMGVFRFYHSQDPTINVDVAVGLRRVNRNRWESWCVQQCCQGGPLELVFRNFDNYLRSKKPNVESQDRWFPYDASHGYDYPIISMAKVIDMQMHGRSYITLQVIDKPEIYSSRELKYLSTTSEIPTSTGFDVATDLQEEVGRQLMACSVDDAVDLSIFPSSEITTRVRIDRIRGKARATCIEQLFELMSEIPHHQLEVRDPKMEMSRKSKNLSAELLSACRMGNASEVVRLLDSKAMIEAETKNFYSFRPIHWATICGYPTIIRLLLAAKAALFSTTSHGLTVIHLAAMMGYFDILPYFFNEAEKIGVPIDDLIYFRTEKTLESSLHLAAAFAPRNMVKSVLGTIERGQGGFHAMTTRNYLDETPLHRAAAMNNVEAVKYMIEIRDSIDDTDQFGRTPLWHAACAGASDVITVLAEYGVPLDLADDIGRTPLIVASREGRTEAVKALLELGAGPNVAVEPVGLTACHYAVLYGHSSCLRLLLEYCDADAATSQPVSFKPIHLASANGRLDCVELLCATGSDPDCYSSHYILVDTNGSGARLVAKETQSAEEIAVLLGNVAVIEFLRERKRQQKQPNEAASVFRRRDTEQNESIVDIGTLQGY